MIDADRLAVFAERTKEGALIFEPERRIVLALCDVAKAAQYFINSQFPDGDGIGANLFTPRTMLNDALRALSTAFAEPATDQKERS